jgi:SAM-dependent methyltransferase
MTADQATPYDEVRYRTEPNPAAHPGKLAAIGRLHGLSTAAGARSRVLEIGCSDGGHLLALADLAPDAGFVGCDLAPTAIASARERAHAAGTVNAQFHVADVRALPGGLGRFDCVIAHGLYSWIADDARDALLATCARLLADDGIAFVSYNVLPGAHLRRMIREILLLHVGGIADIPARLAEARALAQLLTREGDREDADNAAMRYELRQILARSDQALRHDDLADESFAPSFSDFVAHAQAHGLAFVAEAEYFTEADLGLSASTRAVLAGMERLAREQYRDFLGCRRFRQTLLCRADQAVRERPDPAAVDALYVSAPHAGAAVPAPQAPGEALERRVLALLAAVHAAAPQSLSFEEARASFGRDAAVADLRGALVEGLRTGRLQLSVTPCAARREVSAKPRAGAFARLQAQTGELVANADLRSIRLDDPQARALFCGLDGTNTIADLVQLLRAQGHAAMADAVAESLARFAKLGLLIG